MDVERDNVAPAREEPSADEHRSDGEALSRVAPGRTGARAGSSLNWAPADVAALQRTAGNAVVARMLAPGNGSRAPVKGTARGVIQRDLTTKPKDIATDKGPSALREYLDGLRGYLKLYRHSKGSDKLAYLPLMLANIRVWLDRYKANPGGTTGKESTENYKLERQLEGLKGEIEREQHSAYVEAVRSGEFEYASFESKGQLRKLEQLLSGKTGSVTTGMGPEALKLVRAAGLTEAETLAIKVYTVGDYRAINVALLQWGDEKLTRALHEMGLVKDEGGTPVLPPRILAALDPNLTKGSADWKKKKQRFKRYAPSFKPDLDKVRREVGQHVEMLKAAFSKMPAYKSTKPKENTWRGMRLDPTWPDFKSYTTKDEVIEIKNFYSTSTDDSQAKRFAKKTSNDGRKGFLLECVLKNGRDISMLSEHGKEKEVLVLPGAKLKVKTVLPVQDPFYDYYVLVEEQ